jgi:hypothetical protein
MRIIVGGFIWCRERLCQTLRNWGDGDCSPPRLVEVYGFLDTVLSRATALYVCWVVVCGAVR